MKAENAGSAFPRAEVAVGPGRARLSAARGATLAAQLAVLTPSVEETLNGPTRARPGHRRPREPAAAATAEHAAGRQGAGGDRPATPHPDGVAASTEALREWADTARAGERCRTPGRGEGCATSDEDGHEHGGARGRRHRSVPRELAAGGSRTGPMPRATILQKGLSRR